MSPSSDVVVVGAGLCAAFAAQTLREEGFAGSVVLLGAEPHRPYERPPLSKGYLQGSTEREKVFVHPEGWYREHDVELRTAVEVTAVDRQAGEVVLADGERRGYEQLLLATGAEPRRLEVDGADLHGVHLLRRLEDSDAIREAFAEVAAAGQGRVVIVGGGWIGLETAAAARAAGLDVTVLEQDRLPLLRVLGPEMAQMFADLHRQHAVDLRCGVAVAALTGTHGRVSGVRLRDGRLLPANLVLVGVGVVPRTALAEAAGLEVSGGVVARSILGQDAVDVRPPYFFTDQYDLGMEYTGYVGTEGYERVVVRGRLASREFVAFWLAGGRVIAGMNVNIWDVADQVERLVLSRAAVDPERLADPAVPLQELAGTP